MGGRELISFKEFEKFELKVPENIDLLRKHYYEYLEFKKILMEELK